MRFLSFLMLASMLMLGACKSSQKAQGKKGGPNPFLPTELRDIDFGWAMTRVADIQDLKSTNVQQESFRTTAYQMASMGDIEGVAYYFDDADPQPLYEVLVMYKSEEARDAAASELLGKPNYENNTEWLLESGRGYQLRAWTFKNKLVLVALLPGTEWYEDMNGKE